MMKEELYELLGDIREDYICEAHTTVKKVVPVWLKWSIAACLCLICTCALLLLYPQSEPTQPQHADVLIVNKPDIFSSENIVGFYFRYDDLPKAEWKAATDTFKANIGISYQKFSAKIPDMFTLIMFGSVHVRNDSTNEFNIPRDYVFNIQTENGGSASIRICAKYKPMRDHEFICENQKASYISDVPLYIYSDPIINTFIVDFTYENINYTINTYDMTLEELEILLRGIIQ